MLRPVHNLIASGTNGEIIAPQSVSNLNTKNWCIGINSISVLHCPVVDVCMALTTSLVQKNIAHYFGIAPSETYEPLHIVKMFNSTQGRHIKINAESNKLFTINNIGHQVTFKLHNLVEEDHCPTLDLIIHFSLYFLK